MAWSCDWAYKNRRHTCVLQERTNIWTWSLASSPRRSVSVRSLGSVCCCNMTLASSHTNATNLCSEMIGGSCSRGAFWVANTLAFPQLSLISACIRWALLKPMHTAVHSCHVPLLLLSVEPVHRLTSNMSQSQSHTPPWQGMTPAFDGVFSKQVTSPPSLKEK